jgi:prepilin-type N-terminal cleavage/methylation domain-containing protein
MYQIRRSLDSLARAKDEAFTVIELLVVLVVIGILSGIAFVGITTAHKNSIQDSCKAAYQTISLGVSSYQTDHAGNMPGSLNDLEPRYVSASTIESYQKDFTLQLGTFSATAYSINNGMATITFANTYKPNVTVGEKVVVAGIDSALIDGTWTVLTAPQVVSEGISSFTFQGKQGVNKTASSPIGGYVNFISKAGDPFDVYVFDKTGKLIPGTAPISCGSL